MHRAVRYCALFSVLVGLLTFAQAPTLRPAAAPGRPALAAPAPVAASAATAAVDSNPLPHPEPPPPSKAAHAPIAASPGSSASATVLLLPSGASGANDKIWRYRNGGWAGSTPPQPGWHWLWIAADPFDSNRWLLLGNSPSSSSTSFDVTTNVVRASGTTLSPLWLTTTAGATWQQVTLTTPTNGPTYTNTTINVVEFDTTTVGAIAFSGQVFWPIGFGLQGSDSVVWRGTVASASATGFVSDGAWLETTYSVPGVAGDLVVAEADSPGPGTGGRLGYVPSNSGTIIQSGTEYYYHALQIDRLPGTARAVVGTVPSNFGTDQGTIMATSDYRTTAPTVRLSGNNGSAIATTTNAVYAAGRDANGSGTGGVLKITNILDTPVTAIVAGEGTKTNFVRSDRKSHTAVAALHREVQTNEVALYLTTNEVTWSTLPGPAGVPASTLADRLEIIAPKAVLSNDQNATTGTCQCNAHKQESRPINTRSGAYWTRVTDVVTGTPPLAWIRTYNSQALTQTTALLGVGWQHPFATHIITPTTEPGRVLLFSPEGNVWRYSALPDGSYQAFPGVYSSLVRGTSVFTLTLRDQQQWIFDAASGRMVRQRDAQGRWLALSYDASNRLTQISDEADASRRLDLTYDGAGHIQTVGDGSRTVTYSYANDDLVDVADVIGRHTTYSYQTTPAPTHLLTRITNALGQTVEEQTYDTASPPRVIGQTLQDGRQLTFQYLDSTTIITTTGADGRQDVQAIDYALDNTVAGVRRNGQAIVAETFDDSFSPGAVSDGNGNTTYTSFTSDGLPTAQTNALGQRSQAFYDGKNNLIKTIDPLGATSLFLYDSYNSLISATVGITTTSPTRATTLFRYQYRHPNGTWDTTAANATDSRLFEQTAPDGVVTHYDYADALHPRLVMGTTVGYGTPLAQTTTYAYDDKGRLTATTMGAGTPLERTDTTVYNADNTIARTIRNQKGAGVFNAARPDENITTSYGYDALGRTIAITNTLGQVDVTHYDDHGRVDWTARNASTPLQFDAGLPRYHAYNQLFPDRNVNTLYGYDGLGHTAFVTETGILSGAFNPATLQFSDVTTRTTHTEFDTLSRPVTVTLNYRAGLPTSADTNVKLYTRYDGAGNVITQTDALGRWNVTQYDALNRPITVTLNYDDGNPRTGPADADLITVTYYDAAGRADRQIDNFDNGNFIATETITDRVTLFQYDSLGRVITSTLNYDPPTLGTQTDTNRVSLTRYDAATTHLLGTRDPLGRWVSQQYDLLGRVKTTISNCTAASAPQSCGTATADQNVPATTRYDALGQVYETEDALSHVTHATFDGLGRGTATVQNYTAGAPTSAITNVTTLNVFDALGRTTVLTDALGAATHFEVNGLGQTVAITDTVGRVTRMGYDGTGALRWTKRPEEQITVYQVDGLGRVVTTIVNYQDGAVGANEPSDQDLITSSVYDKAGRHVQAIDAAGRATVFAYDNLDQLIAVTENVVSGTCANPPCNVVTHYQYDRVGNRTAIVDANGHVRRFSYTAADELLTATDALTHTTSYAYDRAGRLINQQDPRDRVGPVFDDDLTYSYDGLGRPISISAGSPAALSPITRRYDPLGHTLAMTDTSGTTSFSYDPLGRITSVSAPNTGTVAYGYDARGLRTQIQYPNAGPTLQYGYWPDGRLRVVTDTTTLASYDYDDAGRLETITRANGATTTYTYDRADRLRDLRTTANSATVSQFTYDVNRLGLRTVVTETLPLGGGGMGLQSAQMAAAPAGSSPLTAASGAQHPQLAAMPIPESVRPAATNELTATIQKAIRQFPLAFVPNAGQAGAAVRYQAHGLGGTLFFTPREVVLALPAAAPSQAPALARGSVQARQARPNRTANVLRLRFVGAVATPTLGATDLLSGTANYLLGNDPAQWRTNLPTYAGLTYQGLYTGIALHYDGTEGQLKGTYTVAAGADPSRIRWRYDGAQQVQVDVASGDLRITLPAAAGVVTPTTVIEHAPVAWQVINGRQVDVPVRYVVAPDGRVGFTLGAYDTRQPLTIDPTLSYSTYLGGSNTDEATSVAIDPTTGNAYVTGYTFSTNFPILGGVDSTLDPNGYDVFVTKLNATGTALVYSTYLGGNSEDYGMDIAVDGAGAVYLTGTTYSTTFPTLHATQAANPGGGMAFVTKLAPAGNALVYSTYLGGSAGSAGTGGSSIAVDSAGNAFVTGSTTSATFPVTPSRYDGTCGGCATGDSDAFVTKFVWNASINQLSYGFSTFLGGDTNDGGTGIAVDSSGVTVAGNTYSTNYPIFPNAASVTQGANAGSNDGFVTKLNTTGTALVYSTYLGGIDFEALLNLALDNGGNALVTGRTYSTNFPTHTPKQATKAGGEDAFVTRYSWNGTTLSYLYSTYLGGSGNDEGLAIAINSAGSAYVTGSTSSTNFPTTTPLQASCASCPATNDAFVTKLNWSGTALSYGYSTFLGGNNEDDGYGIAVDSTGNAYVAGMTSSTNFPTSTPAWDNTANGFWDAFVTKLAPPGISINNVSVTEGAAGTTVNANFTVSLSAAANEQITVHYATANGTGTGGAACTSGVDYITKSGTLTFSANQTSQTLPVTVCGDALDEPNQTFVVNLSSPTNGIIADSQGQGMVVDDDMPSITITNASATEGQNATFTVSLSQASWQTVTVQYATANGSATGGASCASGADHVTKSGTLTFAAGQTSQPIVVTTCDDALDEDDETFVVNLSSPTNATIGDNQGVGTIVDNDPPPAISINDVSVAEGTSGTSNASLMVSLSAVSGRTVTVQYTTANGTANGGAACTGGVDYVTKSGTLTFTAGQASQPIAVTVCGDATYEQSETFTVNLSAPVNATLVDSQGAATISDEDAATRVISYTYDGLLRLTGATETPGLTYAYSYDDAGNRTSVQVNGVTTESRSYNGANQVVGWSYDLAGNLLGDGTVSYSYDALNRLLTTTQGSQTRSNTYNGDGALVTQVANGSTTRYTQDLASPLSQVLQTSQGSATTNYLYGLEQLASRNGATRTWYVDDGLGSVRRTLDDSGAVLGTTLYDPWGTVEGGAPPSPFGFTGEVQDPATGLVNLRARWYSTSRGTFTAYRWRTDESDDMIPDSHHPYAYALDDPVLLTDPAGTCAIEDDADCHKRPRSSDPRNPVVCPKGYFWGGPSDPECRLEAPYTDLPSGPLADFYASLDEPIDIGFALGAGGSYGLGAGGSVGFETVFDLYDFEADTFVYGGGGGLTIGGSLSAYVGAIWGWSGFARDGIGNYHGPFVSFGGSVTPATGTYTFGPPDPESGSRLRGLLLGISVSTSSLKVNGRSIPIDFSALPEPLRDLCGFGGGSWYWSLDNREGDFKLLPTRQKFHRHGFRKQTMRDAREFAWFIDLSVPKTLANIMKEIVFHNAKAWEKKHHIYES